MAEGACRASRIGARRAASAALAGLLALQAPAAAESPRAPGAATVVATGVPRPLQLAWDGRAVLVLSPGARGDAAGEIYRLHPGEPTPVDLSHQPRTRIPFAHAGARTLGSLAVDPATGALFLGEENGTRIFRLDAGDRLTLYATGLRRLPGGSALAFDGRGRLVVVDHADPFVSQADDRPPPGLDLREEDYRGPLVLRLALDAGLPLPRRVGALPPLFPRGWGGASGGGLLPHLISVAPLPQDDLLLLSSTGELFRLGSAGRLVLAARLPRGQYNRTNMVAALDGTVFVSGGFHSGRVFRVAPDGAVAVVAADLADPAGLALDDREGLYIAESALHRILRVPLP